MKSIIKASRLKVFDLFYRIDGSFMEFVIRPFWDKAEYVYLTEAVLQLQDDMEVLKLNNFEFKLYKTPFEDSVTFHIQILEEYRDTRKMVLHNHVLGLFRNSPEVLHEIVSNTDLTTIDLCPNATQLSLDSDKTTVDAEYAEQFFSKCETLNGAIVLPIVEPLLSKNSRLNVAKNLYFVNAYEQVNVFALHFKGHHALFEDAKCDNITIEQFLKRWIAHEAFRELKSLDIQQTPGWYFSPDYIHENIPAER